MPTIPVTRKVVPKSTVAVTLFVAPSHATSSNALGQSEFPEITLGTRSHWVPSRFDTTVRGRTTKPVPTSLDLLQSKDEWADREYRACYAEAAVEQGVAFQIQVNRKLRGRSQKDLADRIGTKQNAVSRLEDPEYGAHSMRMLMKVAAAFYVALVVKLASFSTLARESESLSEGHLYAASYDDEMRIVKK